MCRLYLALAPPSLPDSLYSVQADQYCTPDDDSNLFPMLLVRVCLGSSVGSTGRDGEADPVVPSLRGRMMQKMGIGNPSKYFRNARSVASKMSKVAT